MMDDETYIARVKRSRKRFADNLLTADIVDDGDEKPASCHIRKLDALLAKANTSLWSVENLLVL